MLEIEMKFSAPDFAALERLLQGLQARRADVLEEVDQYYAPPDRDFGRTDEALRLRRIGSANIVTYKGPKQPGATKTRTEIEVNLEPGEEAADKFGRLLTHLRYRAVAVVRKKRLCYHFERDHFALQVCLDDVEQVGRFAEIEAIAPEGKKQQAQELIQKVAAELGLNEPERRSYLEMVLLACAQPVIRGLRVTPVLAKTVTEVSLAVAAAQRAGRTVGLVPTMGALHAGHASLIRQARADSGYVVVSIFVNPTQFGPREDLTRYPRPFENDVALCAAEGVDLIFHPEPETIYPPDYHTFVEVHELQDVLCGSSRPGHFRGVATVVLKLFNIVRPDAAYFGQKDAQQVRILQQMVHDLNVPVNIAVCPIVREADGLALSSRNVYLRPEERRRTLVLSRVLEEIRRRVAAGERQAGPLLEWVRTEVAAVPGTRLDYASVVDLKTLQPLAQLTGQVLVALAVFVGETRLIDNVILEITSGE